MIAIGILSILLIIGIGVLIYVSYLGNAKQRLIVKMIDSTLFVVIGCLALGYAEALNTTYAILILAGAGFSFLGDLLLGINYNKPKTTRNHSFVFGGISFFVAQVCYSIGFVSAVGYLVWLFIIPVLAIIAVVACSYIPQFNIKNKLLVFLVAGYAFMVAFSCTAALNFVIAYGFTNLVSLVSLGGIFFITSDYLLLHKYFYHKQYRLVNIIYLSTYYLAQLIYMLSILYVK